MASPIPSPDPNSVAWNIYVDTQNVTLIGPDGTPQNVSLSDINDNTYYILTTVASNAFAIGVTGVLMIVLLMQADRKKARRPIFILNFAALFFVCLKAITVVCGWCSRWVYGVAETMFALVAQYDVASAYSLNTIGLICQLLCYPLIMASLILQVRVVFAAEPKSRLLVTVFLTITAMLVYGAMFAYVVWLFEILYGQAPTFNNFTELFRIWSIGLIVFVGFSCVLFLYKLLVTIQRRKGMGFKSFGPLHVLAIMFVVLLIIQQAYANGKFNLTELTLTVLVASLPLSSIWASHIAEGAARQAVTTTSSSVTTSSGLSHRIKHFKNFFSEKKPDSKSSYFSDLEKASNISDPETGKRTNSLDVTALSPHNESSEPLK